MLNTNSQRKFPLLSRRVLSVSAGVFAMASVGAMSLVFAPHSSSSEIASKKIPAAAGAALATVGFAITGETDLSNTQPASFPGSTQAQSSSSRELYLNPYVAQDPQFVDHAVWSSKELRDVTTQESVDKPLYD